MKIHFTTSHTPLAQKSFAELTRLYGQTAAAEADVIVSLGGDGHVLRVLYETISSGKPVFAMRRTESVGFLCNSFCADGLIQRLKAAQRVILHPLRLQAATASGAHHEALAINEITLLRETAQAAKLRIAIDGIERIAQYSGDGLLLSSPAGSTAYNHSCGGPIMPLDSHTLVMTAISGYRPRGWSYAVLPHNAAIEVEILESIKRPVRIECGITVIRQVAKAKMWLDHEKSIQLMFDPDQHLGERIIREQFML